MPGWLNTTGNTGGVQSTTPASCLACNGQTTESDDTLEMSHGMVKKYLNEESNLEYTFNIRNLKEEAKDEDFESGIDDSD